MSDVIFNGIGKLTTVLSGSSAQAVRVGSFLALRALQRLYLYVRLLFDEMTHSNLYLFAYL